MCSPPVGSVKPSTTTTVVGGADLMASATLSSLFFASGERFASFFSNVIPLETM